MIFQVMTPFVIAITQYLQIFKMCLFLLMLRVLSVFALLLNSPLHFVKHYFLSQLILLFLFFSLNVEIGIGFLQFLMHGLIVHLVCFLIIKSFAKRFKSVMIG